MYSKTIAPTAASRKDGERLRLGLAAADGVRPVRLPEFVGGDSAPTVVDGGVKAGVVSPDGGVKAGVVSPSGAKPGDSGSGVAEAAYRKERKILIVKWPIILDLSSTDTQ